MKPTSARQVIDLLGALIEIESVTPSLIADGAGGQSIARFIADWLAAIAADVEIIDIDRGMLARLRGTGSGPTLCLNAHTDTVGYEGWPERALVPEVRGDHMFGLGASDDKGGCAAAMLALRSIAEAGVMLRGDVLVAFVGDAEGDSIGSKHLAKSGGIDAAIVIEPQPIDHLVVEHQGFGWVDLITYGVAAHGAAPEAGVDAIVHMAEVITRLHRLDRTQFQANPSLLNGKIVFHAATISGGTHYATYPDVARLGIEVGTQPGEHLSDRIDEIKAIFAEVSSAEPGFRADIEVKLDCEPFVAAGHEELQKVVTRAMSDVLGRTPRITGMNAWSEAAILQAAGIPTLLMGSPGGNAHTAGEWTSISGIAKLSEILASAAVAYLA